MRVVLKGVHRVSKRLSSGAVVVYHYAWRGGPRLKGEPGSAEFLTSYHEAHRSREQRHDGTLFALIAEYKASAEFCGLRERTRRDYLRYVRLIENEFGDMPLEVLNDPLVRGEFKRWRDRMADRPRTADLAWTVLARILSFGKDRGRLAINACERGGRLYRGDRSDAIWTKAMIAIAIAGLPAHLRHAFMLALWTGQRQGDLLRLPWSAFDGSCIRLKQSKGGRRVTVPVAAPLLQEIAAIPKRGPLILTNQQGRPWSEDGFRTSWRKAVAKLRIEGVTFHDLRGSAVTRLAEAGCSEAEIAAITGHSLRDVGSILDRYLGRTEALAENAIRRLDGRDRERDL